MHRFTRYCTRGRIGAALLLTLTALLGIAYAGDTIHFKGPVTFDDVTSFDGSDRNFTDNTKMTLGTGADYDFYFDGTDLILEPNTDDLLWKVGNGTESSDLKWFFGSAAKYLYFDASANLIYTTDVDLKLIDSDHLLFGTTAGAGTATGDYDFSFNGTKFITAVLTDDTVWEVGDGTTSSDLKWFLSSSSDYIYFDASKDEIQLTGNAKIIPTNGIEWFDDFMAEVFDPNEYTTNEDAGGTPFAITEAAGGTLVGSADNETNDKEEFAGAIAWTTSKVTVFECRVKTDDITTNAFNIGLNDAKNQAATTIAWTIGGGNALTTNSADGVGFVFDTRADTDGWWGIISGTSDEKQGSGATAPTNNTYQTLRFEIDASRKVSFFINGVAYGAQTTAALDASTALCLYIGNQSTTTATRTWTVDYVYIWQDR
jgi:hypothetical protein